MRTIVRPELFVVFLNSKSLEQLVSFSAFSPFLLFLLSGVMPVTVFFPSMLMRYLKLPMLESLMFITHLPSFSETTVPFLKFTVMSFFPAP